MHLINRMANYFYQNSYPLMIYSKVGPDVQTTFIRPNTLSLVLIIYTVIVYQGIFQGIPSVLKQYREHKESMYHRTGTTHFAK